MTAGLVRVLVVESAPLHKSLLQVASTTLRQVGSDVLGLRLQSVRAALLAVDPRTRKLTRLNMLARDGGTDDANAVLSARKALLEPISSFLVQVFCGAHLRRPHRQHFILCEGASTGGRTHCILHQLAAHVLMACEGQVSGQTRRVLRQAQSLLPKLRTHLMLLLRLVELMHLVLAVLRRQGRH